MSESLDEAFDKALRAVRREAKVGRHSTLLRDLKNPSDAEWIIRRLRWRRKLLSPVWLAGSITDISAPVSRSMVKELYRSFDLHPEKPAPSPGWEVLLHSQDGAKIYVANRAGKYEANLQGRYDRLFPWIVVS